MNKKEFYLFSKIIVGLQMIFILLYWFLSCQPIDMKLITKIGMINLVVTGGIWCVMWLWKKYPKVQKKITPKPYLHGTWIGGIKRTNDTEAYPFMLVITQDFFSVKCYTISAHNKQSKSYSAQITFEDESIQLLYNWEGSAIEKEQTFLGVTSLTYDAVNKVLHGTYFSQNMNGALYLTFLSKELLQRYDDKLFTTEFKKAINQQFETPNF